LISCKRRRRGRGRRRIKLQKKRGSEGERKNRCTERCTGRENREM
jgi:hypothetical protein